MSACLKEFPLLPGLTKPQLLASHTSYLVVTGRGAVWGTRRPGRLGHYCLQVITAWSWARTKSKRQG